MAYANTAPARRAQFDGATQHRRSMVAKIQVAKQQLRIVEDDYRQMLLDATGETSLTRCDDRQLAKMIDALKAKGFRPLPPASVQAREPGQRRSAAPARHPMALKARALWISLHQLGVVHNPSEAALEAFAKRQLGCERLVWARQSSGFQLIEALKAMAFRAGWSAMGGPLTQQANLCAAILAKLKEAGAVPADWALHDAAWKLCGIENGRADPWTAEDYQRLAGGLGAKLRAAMGGQADA